MNFIKIFSFFLISAFLMSNAAAVVADAVWIENEAKSLMIENGESASFEVFFFATNPPMNIRAELYDSSDSVIYTFLDLSTVQNEYVAVYSIDRSIYGTPGNFKVILNSNDRYSSQSDEIYLTVTPDTTSPIITLNGANPQNIIVGNVYVELGATAIDSLDGNLTSEIAITGSVDTNVIGSYDMTYSVSDDAGNTATAIRTVNVVEELDTTSPLITIQSPTEDSTYNLTSLFLNFIASDENLDLCEYSIDNGVTRNPIACSSDDLVSISLTALEGANEWIVYASDVSGNEASASVNFNVDTTVEDITAPVITIINPEEDETIKSSRLTIQIATDEDATVKFALDDEDSETMENPEDHIFTYSLSGLNNGEHTIIFTAEDTAGNIATRSVTFEIHKKSSGSSSGTGLAETSSSEEQTGTGSSIGLGEIKDVMILGEEAQGISCPRGFFGSIFDAIINFFKRLFGGKN